MKIPTTTKTKPQKITAPLIPVMLRLTPELAQTIRDQAAAERRTINAVATYALLQYLAEVRQEKKEARR